MKYLNKSDSFSAKSRFSSQAFNDNDPLTGLANLFDIGLVFIVGLILALMSTYHVKDLMDNNSEITILKKQDNGDMEIITKKGKKVSVKKITKSEAQGRGQRLGTAYRLEGGEMVYVPD
ncbi:MAG: DUF2149 domain-containing protein [Desulfobacteraceae bacterium]